MKRKMGFSFSSSSSFTVIALGLLLFITGTCYAHNSNTLSTHFYSKSCPKVFSSVKSVVRSAVAKEPRMGASLLRLHFHDCFVHGCDGSLLLDGPNTEKTALPNNNSVRGFEVVDAIKSKVEKACPGIVSCADILTIAARDSVKILGGPSWDVKLGRRDSRRAFLNEANSGVIPPPSSTLSNLINRFRARGLSTKDMVALSGAHTIGKARCTIFRNRIYNETNIDPKFAKIRQKTCPRTGGSGDDNLAPFDIQTPNCFDNLYYQNLINKKGLLRSDQILFNGTGTTDSLVKTYYNDQERFFCDFIEAMIKMGDIRPLTGSRGEIRRNCRMPN